MKLKFIEKLKLENNNSIILIKGLKQKGKDFWVYMEMNKNQIEILNRNSDKGQEIILSHYGKEVESGFGKKPNSQTRNRMKKEFGFEE